jgi:thioredoxin 1
MTLQELETLEQFTSLVTNAPGLVLVDYSATWCGPCKRIYPTIVKFSKEFTSIQFYKVDVDDNEDVTKEQNIEAMPTFVLYRDGKEIQRIVGADTSTLRETLEDALKPEVNMDEVLNQDPLGLTEN